MHAATIGAFAVLTTSTPALAATLSGTADPGLGRVQWSGPGQPTYARYDITIQNTGQANISGWRFRAKTSVVGGTGSPAATFNKEFSNPKCDLLDPAVPTEIVCDFSDETLPGVTGTRTFSVVLNAPSSGTEIDFSWRAFWDESGSGGNDGFKAATPTLVYPPNPELVSSVVPAGAPVLTFFTGTGIATPTDPWVTIVRVPTTSLTTTATVEEDVSVSQCSADLLDCRTTTMTIPSTFGTLGDPITAGTYLRVTLLRDASTIAKGARIDAAVLYYKHDPNAAGIGIPIVSCAVALPQPGAPCEDLSQRTAYPKKSTPKTAVPAGFESDWSFTVYLYDNGRITN